MGIAGNKTSVLRSETPEGLACPKCSKKNSTNIDILGKYRHLLLIPFISKGKSGISNCKSCNTTYDVETMPDAVKLAYYELKEPVKTPIWFYAGLIGIKVLVLIKIFSKYI